MQNPQEVLIVHSTELSGEMSPLSGRAAQKTAGFGPSSWSPKLVFVQFEQQRLWCRKLDSEWCQDSGM